MCNSLLRLFDVFGLPERLPHLGSWVSMWSPPGRVLPTMTPMLSISLFLPSDTLTEISLRCFRLRLGRDRMHRKGESTIKGKRAPSPDNEKSHYREYQ
jgi:hypothetical protein